MKGLFIVAITAILSACSIETIEEPENTNTSEQTTTEVTITPPEVEPTPPTEEINPDFDPFFTSTSGVSYEIISPVFDELSLMGEGFHLNSPGGPSLINCVTGEINRQDLIIDQDFSKNITIEKANYENLLKALYSDELTIPETRVEEEILNEIVLLTDDDVTLSYLVSFEFPQHEYELSPFNDGYIIDPICLGKTEFIIGNSFISKIKLGGKFILVNSVTFKTPALKNEYESKITNHEYFIFDEFNTDEMISLNKKIFSKKTKFKRFGGNFHISEVICIDDQKFACLNSGSLNEVINYINHDFVNELNESMYPALLSFEVTTYNEASMDQLPQLAKFPSEVKTLESDYLELLRWKKYSYIIKKLYKNIPDQQFSNKNNQLESLIDRYDDSIYKCRSDISQCALELENLTALKQEYGLTAADFLIDEE